MKGLLKNELIKTWKQTGNRVCLIVLVALLFLTTVGGYFLSAVVNGISGYNLLSNRREAELDAAKWYQENGQTVEAQISFAHADSYLLYIDNGLEADSWRYEEYFYSRYQPDYLKWYLYSCVVDGTFSGDELVNASYTDYVPDKYVTKNENGTVSLAPGFDFARERDRLKASLKLLEYEILHADCRDKLVEKVAEAESTVARDKLNVAQLEITAKITPSDLAEYNLQVAKLTLEGDTEVLNGYRWLLDHDVDMDNWEYTTVTEVLTNAAACYPEFAVQSRDLYEQNGGQHYSIYCRQAEEVDRATREAVSTVWYSLEHGVPIAGTDGASVKSILTNRIDSVCGWVTILLIVMAVLSVSSEFTSGTVRLLVIRPKKRSRIITSKLLCVLLWGAGMTVISFLLLTGITMLLNGVGDLFVPQLIVLGGKTVAVPAVLYLLGYLVLNLLMSLFYASVAFLLATLIRRSALPIVIGILLTMVGSGVQTAVLYLQRAAAIHVMDFTILTNFSLTSRLGTAAEAMLGNGITTYLITNSPTFWACVLTVVLHLAFFVWLSILSFSKRQIMN